MKGSNFKHLRGTKVGGHTFNITLGCMSEEARTLLDTLVEEFEKLYGEDSVHKKTAYFGLYWACRWSGLIQPSDVVNK